ncbi:M42 family metallopeptidase [Clostridium sediminicola]|uniref:M42 family metallopeptidase n=1 Tax=Clostridium sediminicola TaxID=3114879 RepID=UPI0031F224E8
MNYNINKDYITKILEDILNTASPSGFCHEIMNKIEKYVKEFGFEFEKTNKGCGIITLPGGNSDYVIGLSAHVDTLGAMVRAVKNDGKIRFTTIGGYMMSTVEGEYCTIHTRDGKRYSGTVLTTQPSVHVYSEARKQERKEENMEIRIDELVNSKEDVITLGIEAGDFISFDSRTSILENGFIKSRHLDDKAGIGVLFGFMEYINREKIKLKNTVKIVISVYEEVGHGASYIPQDIDEFIAIDMGAMGEDLSCTEQQVSICAKDSSGPYDYHMVSRFIEIAKENELNYAVDIYPFYGSDVSAALRGGNNIKGALIGPGVHASHGMERTHIDGIINTVGLLIGYTV